MTVLTYNVHGCVGIDGLRSEKRIAEVIASFRPDIVGLQELDVGRSRSKGVDQAETIAAHLGFNRLFHPAMRVAEGEYGDAILSRWPMTVRRSLDLPSENAFPFRETRGALWVEVDTPEGPVDVVNTHFGVGARERRAQAESLLELDSVFSREPQRPALVMGDFNSRPGSWVHRRLCKTWHDATLVHGRRHRATFPTVLPVFTLDYFFVNDAWTVHGTAVGRGREAREASDHFPLVGFMDVKLVAKLPHG